MPSTAGNEKPVIVFFFEKKMGGIAYMNIEIINHSRIRDHFQVRIILMKEKGLNKDEELFDLNINADEIHVFTLDADANRYYELKRLHDMIGNEEGAIVTNNSLELDCIGLFGTTKTVYQIIHDFYSVKLFLRRSQLVDVFLTHSKFWKDVLYSTTAVGDGVYKQIVHGVELIDYSLKNKPGKTLKIAFTGRFTTGKGVNLLKDIDTELRQRNINAEWTIIGSGPLKDYLTKQWENDNNVRIISPVNHDDVLNEMVKCDLFVLPTEFEGYGIAIVEALSCGLVPIISDVAGGTAEILATVGYRISFKNAKGYADVIEKLNADREDLVKQQLACRRLAEEKYNIDITANNYLAEFIKYKTSVREKRKIRNLDYGFSLDKRFYPDFLVKFLRSTKRFIFR